MLPSKKSYLGPWGILLFAVGLGTLSACLPFPIGGGGADSSPVLGQQSSSIAWPTPQPTWQPILLPAEIAVNEKAFPLFRPELVAPKTWPTSPSLLVPYNYAPALFFGHAATQELKALPNGVMIQTNGFDSIPASTMPPAKFTYYNLFHSPLDVQLGLKKVAALPNLEQRLKVPATNNPPAITVDQRNLILDLQEVVQVLDLARDAVVMHFPEAAGVDIRNCEIVIEPTIFYVLDSNFGNVWAGGLAERPGSGKFRLHVILFYINSQGNAYDWRDFLIHEAINFYLVSIGRDDLVF